MHPRSSSRITPTAHYTGFVWCRHALSPPWLGTLQGRALFGLLQPMVLLGSQATGGVTIETFLLERHRLIDACLERAIEQGRIGQVVEIAAGLAGRGLRMVARHGHRGLRYIEADLPAMAERKRRLLARHARPDPQLQVVALDALDQAGPLSLEQTMAERLDPTRGTALVVEGLLTYLDRPLVLGLWGRWSRWLARFPHGLYLSDVHVADQRTRAVIPALFVRLLGLFAGTRVHLHFSSPEDAVRSAMDAGFAEARVLWPDETRPSAGTGRRGPRHYVGVLEAQTG
jgi:O-methyltransferase involved in polyketide biosynthesis